MYEFENPLVEAAAYINYSWFKHQVGDIRAVREYCRQCMRVLCDRKNPELEWNGSILLGNATMALGEFTEAEEFYRKAVSLGIEMHKQRHELEAQAGLARVFMARAEPEVALTQVNEILAYMEANTPPKGSSFCLDGTEEPFRILLTCYQVLKANDDPRSAKILTDAYNLLQTRAANISDEHLRFCFLNNVAANREIVEEYENSGLGGLET